MILPCLNTSSVDTEHCCVRKHTVCARAMCERAMCMIRMCAGGLNCCAYCRAHRMYISLYDRACTRCVSHDSLASISGCRTGAQGRQDGWLTRKLGGKVRLGSLRHMRTPSPLTMIILILVTTMNVPRFYPMLMKVSTLTTGMCVRCIQTVYTYPYGAVTP